MFKTPCGLNKTFGGAFGPPVCNPCLTPLTPPSMYKVIFIVMVIMLLHIVGGGTFQGFFISQS